MSWAALFGYDSTSAQKDGPFDQVDAEEEMVDLPKEGQSDLSEEDLEEEKMVELSESSDNKPVLCRLDLFDNMSATEMETDTGSVVSDSSSTETSDEAEIAIMPVEEEDEEVEEEVEESDSEYQYEEDDSSESDNQHDVPYRLRAPAMPCYECKWCKISFTNRSELDEHYNSCELYIKAIRHYTCKCGKICVNLNGFKTHCRFCNKAKRQIVKFECLACPKRFNTRQKRNKHHDRCKIMRAYSKKDQFICPFCKRIFKTARSRGQHYHGCRKTSREHQAKYIY